MEFHFGYDLFYFLGTRIYDPKGNYFGASGYALKYKESNYGTGCIP